MAWLLRLCTAFLAASPAVANSKFMAALCRGHTCGEMRYPILDYDGETNRCMCRAHPCWDDSGRVHSCDSEQHPHLSFSYDTSGALSCGCSATPHYDALHIAKDLCPGHFCEDEQFPVLDYNSENGLCICRAHPCTDMEGMKHECTDPKFPILRYREDEPPSEGAGPKAVCECLAKLVHNEEL